MSTTKGIRAEQRVARELKAMGYLPASRRHLGGAGDLLMEDWRPGKEALLVEVKATAGPYDHFPKEDRKELLATCFHFDLEPLLAWVTPRGTFFIEDCDWPA